MVDLYWVRQLSLVQSALLNNTCHVVWYSFSAGGNTTHQRRQTEGRQLDWSNNQLKYIGNCNKSFCECLPSSQPPSSDHFTPALVGWAPNRYICTKWHGTSGQLTKPGWALFPRQVKLVFSWEIWFEAKKLPMKLECLLRGKAVN